MMTSLSGHEQHRLDQYRERAYDHNKLATHHVDYDELHRHIGRYIVNLHEMRTLGRIAHVEPLKRNPSTQRQEAVVTMADGTIMPFSFDHVICVAHEKVESIYHRNEMVDIKELLAREDY